MLDTIKALVSYLLTNRDKLFAAGLDLYDLYTKVQAVIDQHRVPNDPEWDALDAQAKELQASVRDTSGDYKPGA